MKTSSRIASIVGVPTIFVAAAWLYAGPLNPPSGAISSTGKTLTEVEPRIAINLANTPGDADSVYKITQPGSYYLVGNLIGVVNKHGIEIASNGVTIDLNGFDVSAFGAASGAKSGISVTTSGLSTITIRNGSIRNWGGSGVRLGEFGVTPASNCHFDNIAVSGNSTYGIFSGSSSVITRCTSTNNGADGIYANDGCTITTCVASNNGSNGILTTSGCTIAECEASGNTLSGINASTGCVIRHCVSYANTLDGIRVSLKNLILANECANNGQGAGDGAGIHITSSDNRIEGNNFNNSDRGIDIDINGNIIIKNTCSGNTVNWTIAAGNSYLVVQAPMTSSNFSGNAGGGGVGTTDPNANFTY